MQVRRLKVHNYRTLEDFEATFSTFYTAICGKNNSGKSNIVRVLRYLLGENMPFRVSEDEDISHKSDSTAWNRSDEPGEQIHLEIHLDLDPINDHGLVEFLGRMGTKPEISETGPVPLVLAVTIAAKDDRRRVACYFANEAIDELGAEEVLKKLRSTTCLLFHNSTFNAFPFMRRGFIHGALPSLEDTENNSLARKRDALNKEIAKSIESQREELARLLGRLNERYIVRLKSPKIDFEQWPLEIALGEKSFDVSLDDWGAGTRNRTLILKSIFDAKNAVEAKAVSDKITPVVLVEEPESFLHPLAQARFGVVLQDLTAELRVQLIVTTHSPYLLSHRDPASNLLLCRAEIKGGYARGTKLVPTNTDNWREPFEHALGIVGPEFDLFKDAVFNTAKTILMVEGPTDKGYMELLRASSHEGNALQFEGEIFDYGGTGTLQNRVMMRFLRDRYSRLVVTYDLDAESLVQQSLDSLGLKKDIDHFGIGLNEAGRRSIEGLLPTRIKKHVAEQHANLVDALQSNIESERKTAREQIKKRYFEAFRESAVPGSSDFEHFYVLARRLTKALKLSSK